MTSKKKIEDNKIAYNSCMMRLGIHDADIDHLLELYDRLEQQILDMQDELNKSKLDTQLQEQREDYKIQIQKKNLLKRRELYKW